MNLLSSGEKLPLEPGVLLFLLCASSYVSVCVCACAEEGFGKRRLRKLWEETKC